MNDILLSIILGVVEGITEFLPVSSTAHLRISQALLGVSLQDEFWKLFAIFIQLGAILSVVLLYRKKLLGFVRGFPEYLRKFSFSHPISLILLAFFCTAIPAFLCKKIIGANLENLNVIATALLVGGLVMIFFDLIFGGRVSELEKMKPWQAIVIGFVQVLSAVFPGTSRSMSTIAAGQLVGLTRSLALEFSFLVSIPVMAVATLYDLLKYVKEGDNPALNSQQLLVLAIGFVVSFLVAYVVVAWFLSYVKKRGFLLFGLYRIALGVVLLYLIHSGSQHLPVLLQ